MNSRAARINRTQWAAQFLAAVELVRRGYVVSFTMGNQTPDADLMVGNPVTGKMFWVDVKGTAGRGNWFVREKSVLPGLFYILVSVSDDRPSDRFFVLSQEEAEGPIREYRAAHPNETVVALTWPEVQPFADQWHTLAEFTLLQSN